MEDEGKLPQTIDGIVGFDYPLRDAYAREVMGFISDTVEALDSLLENINVLQVLAAVNDICAANGKLVTTGLGKAGHVAAKSASSFSSLGIPACYLHPAEASHGDVGLVQPGDTLLVFSTSGKTREVIETIELSRKLGVGKVISITSHPDSPVRSLSDIVIDIGSIPEAGYLALAPTTSVVVMLVVSDIVATMCAMHRGLTKEEFGLRHHGGYLGRKCRGEEP